MKLNYILSETTKCATTGAIKDIIKKAEENPLAEFIVIVPETKSIIIEKELLETSTNNAFANIFIYSFVRLINRLGLVDQNKIVNKQICVMILRKIILDNINSLKCYKKTAMSVGFAEKIYDTIQQFKSSNIEIEELKQHYTNCSKSLKAKLEDFILIYAEYQNVLADRLYDDCDKLNLLINFAENNELLKNSEVYVIGFDNITYEMVSVLKKIAKNAKEITFSAVYFDKNRIDSYIQNNELYSKYKLIGDSLNFAYNPQMVSANLKNDFKAVAENLFDATKQVKSQGNICVFEAKNIKQELDFVANQILIEVEAGKRFKDIGVFVCGLQQNSELIKKCFDTYNIPYFINQENEISNHYLINFIKNCFEIYISHLSTDKVFAFISSIIINDVNFSDFKNFVTEKGISYNRFLNQYEDANEEVKKSFNLLQDFYNKLSRKLKESKVVNDYLDVVNFIFEYFAIKERLEQISVFEKENLSIIDSEISLSLYDKVIEFNKLFSNFMGNLKMSENEFLQIYLSGFASIKIKLSPVSIDSVIVQENTDGFFDIKNLYIINAVDGLFPSKLQDSGIILDSELNEAKEILQKGVEPTIKQINERELFRCYEALLEPSQKLVVSYSLSSNGSANKPSRLVLRLLSLFGENIKTTTYKRLKNASKKVYKNKFAKHISEYLNDNYDFYKLNQEYNIIESELSDRYLNLLNDINLLKENFILDEAKDLFFAGNKTSISQLEKYFMCPYMFFATYGLRLKENKEAKLSSIDIGSIVHRVAEIFIDKINEVSEENLEKCTTNFLEIVFEEFYVNKNSNGAVIELLINEVQKLCKHLFEEQKNTSFKAIANEFTFAGENAVKLKIDDNIINIEGKIDRLDFWQNYVRVIDYKTGDVSSDLSSIYYGKKIQLITYLTAVQNDKTKKVAGVFYMPIHNEFVKNDKKVKDLYKMQGFMTNNIDVLKHMDNRLSFDNPESNFVPIKLKISKANIEQNLFELTSASANLAFSEDEFNKISEYTKKLCEQAVKEIKEGFIEPSPLMNGGDENSLPCKFCEFEGFCGLEKARFTSGRKCEFSADISSFNVGGEDGR